jgi:hypothetical protein
VQGYLENPRRAPRVLARCWAAVTSARGAFDAETEDVAAIGCRLSSPKFVHPGEPILLRLYAQGLRDGLRVPARIAWSSDLSPWRLGVAFDPDARAATQTWFDRLLAEGPEYPAGHGVPARIALRAGVWLGPPPRLVVDLSADELELARSIGAGTTVGALHQRFNGRWKEVQPSFFSLLARRLATLQRGGSVHPAAWKDVLREPAPPDPGAFAPAMVRPEAWAAEGAPRATATDPFWLGRRSAEAEALYARALERLSRNQSTVARSLLLQAQRVAPDDPGIAAALVRSERKD